MYYRGASAAVLVFDITNQDTFQRTQDWVTELRANVMEDILLVVVGNKTDLNKHRAVPRDRGREFAEAINATYIETSAKDGEGIIQLFTEICRKVVSQRKQYLQYTPMTSGPPGQHDSNYIIQTEYETQMSERGKKKDGKRIGDETRKDEAKKGRNPLKVKIRIGDDKVIGQKLK